MVDILGKTFLRQEERKKMQGIIVSNNKSTEFRSIPVMRTDEFKLELDIPQLPNVVTILHISDI